MSQFQDKNNRYETKFNLSELYSLEDLQKLVKIIPELLNICSISYSNLSPNTKLKSSSSRDDSENINILNNKTKIDKFSFLKIVLSKLKSYFEINESFIIMKTISIIIKEINILENYFTIKPNRSKSKNNKNEQKNEFKLEKDYKSCLKFEKIQKVKYKKNSTNRAIITKNNGSNNQGFYLSNNVNNQSVLKKNNNKKKVFFRVLNNPIVKEHITEYNSFRVNTGDIKHVNINLNKTERKLSDTNLSLSKLKKYEFQNIINKQKTSSEVGLKIYIDSDSNNHSHNFTSNFNSINYKKVNNNYINSRQNKSDLFNNNNNLYINIYEHKKNICNLTEHNNSISSQDKTNDKINIEKEVNNNYSNILNNNLLNISLLNDIETDNFDIFELDKKSSKKSLSLIGNYIFNRFGFNNIIKYSMFENWCKKIAEGYNRKNPYHTDIHAGDITQTCLVFFKIGKINEICKLNQLSKCALFLSCICHDYKHPGLNNNFLKDTKNILAIKYNDNSILENMHISEAFKLTIDFPNCDIFSGMNSENYKQMRKEMISCVLFTDMNKHPITVDFMQEVLKNKNNNNKKNNNDNKDKEDKETYQNYMNLLIHSADISNPTKKFNIYWKWAKLVVEEFFQQGDKEKKLGIKCSFDRNTMTVNQNQLGFINYIEIPFFTLFIANFPKLKYLMDNLNNNKKQISLLQEKDKEKEKMKENK